MKKLLIVVAAAMALFFVSCVETISHRIVVPADEILVAADSGGDVDSNVAQLAAVESGTVISGKLYAYPEEGYVFTGWVSDNPAVVFADASAPITTFTMPAGPVSIRATFALEGTVISDVLSLISDPVFLAYCTGEMNNSEYKNWDTDNNGKLSPAEAAAVELIDVTNSGIESLAGLEHFTGLAVLYCALNNLTSLDISANTALYWLQCENNPGIGTLDLSHNPDLGILFCMNTGILGLDLSHNPNLEALDCSYNHLTSLDLSHNPYVYALDCSNNMILSLDISSNELLEQFFCEGNLGDGRRMYIRSWFDSDSIPDDFPCEDWIFIIASSGYVISPVYYTEATKPDFSNDGDVKTLQTASSGAGIDIVLMGDGFTPADHADGTYDRVMEDTIDAFFAEEPYTSFRNMFNVYQVDVVSPGSTWYELSESNGNTALGTRFGGGTNINTGENSDLMAKSYAQIAISSARMNEALVVAVLNTDYFAGTCWMYYPSSGDHSRGLGVAYLTRTDNDWDFIGLVNHEAGGHGFSKLADEYWESPGMGKTVPAAEIADVRAWEPYGWNRNIDFTDDPYDVKWAHFLNNLHYSTYVGTWEGGYYYEFGAFRPAEHSVMRYNHDGYNAPSREAIFYRIHKLAHGLSWSYNFETFAAWDLSSHTRSAAASARRPSGLLRNEGLTGAPPVVVSRPWDEGMDLSSLPSTRSAGPLKTSRLRVSRQPQL